MRNNKCVFYTEPDLNIGDKMIDCDLLTLKNEPVKLLDIIKGHDFKYAFVGGFSSS